MIVSHERRVIRSEIRTLQDEIDALTARATVFYFGITSRSLAVRLSEHRRTKHVSQIKALAIVPHHNGIGVAPLAIRDLERLVVDMYLGKQRCLNQRRGGGGIRRDCRGPFTLYVAWH